MGEMALLIGHNVLGLDRFFSNFEVTVSNIKMYLYVEVMVFKAV
jgi:hypothetical protein